MRSHQSAGALYVLAVKILNQQLVVTVETGPCGKSHMWNICNECFDKSFNILLINVFYKKITDFAL